MNSGRKQKVEKVYPEKSHRQQGGFLFNKTIKYNTYESSDGKYFTGNFNDVIPPEPKSNFTKEIVYTCIDFKILVVKRQTGENALHH